MSNFKPSEIPLESLPPLPAIEAEIERRKQNRIDSYYPETGPLRRELYPKHLAFFAAGGPHEPMMWCPKGCPGEPHRQRMLMAGNRIGKTEGVGGYEVALHLTGRYPGWWPGRRFDRPVQVWAAGDTSKTVRDIIQIKMLGPLDAIGTGMIPADTIHNTVRKQNVADAIELVYVTHASGGLSVMTLKSYDQRREGFQGADIDVIWLDEEPPMDIKSECLLRTMTTNGLVLLTFTPLQGLTELVLEFLPGGKMPETAQEEESDAGIHREGQ